jgi:hypothetical protein
VRRTDPDVTRRINPVLCDATGCSFNLYDDPSRRDTYSWRIAVVKGQLRGTRNGGKVNPTMGIGGGARLFLIEALRVP